MTDWVRLWHDMPTDPKWRTIARKSGQPLPCVIALFNLIMVNASGNALLATAGTGDVLAGMAGARLASGESSFEAACSAVFAHGHQADLWADQRPGQPLTASALARLQGCGPVA